jgi:hypothetical protein
MPCDVATLTTSLSRLPYQPPVLLVQIGAERFYDGAATNWLYSRLDMHIIKPGRQGNDKAFMTGLRVQARF